MPLCSNLSRQSACDLYTEVLAANDTDALRKLSREDLFFLLVVGCKRRDVNKDWLYDRCREVEAAPDGHLDLWAREHYKSTIITYAKTIQDILVDPNTTVGIFSHTRPIAKAFLKQIKTEFETNQFLKDLFPEILYENPQKESSSWSLDSGITVKRSSNPKENTVEAWGLVDGQPTSKHYSLLIYDDVVTRESVTTPEMLDKTTEAWSLSLNLGAHHGKRRFIGTRYHFNDTYRTILDRKTANPRIYAATEDGTVSGKPRFLSREQLEEKRRDMGPYVFGAQMLQNPVADNAQGFKTDWLRFYDGEPPKILNKYVLFDPASKKKKANDYTAAVVIGLGQDQNYYLLDAVRDRLNLTERADLAFAMARKWFPIRTGYETYGLQADIEHIKYMQGLENYRFQIVELGGQMPKEDRVRRLIPIFEAGRFWMPRRLMFKDYEGKAHDFVEEFLREEYSAFPVAIHDDCFDVMARIVDAELGAAFPLARQKGAVATKTNSAYKVL